MRPPKSYEGEGITVRYDVRRCIHAAECVRGLPHVFRSGQKPWVDPAAAPVDEIAAAIERCPSGALTYERTDGGPPEQGGRATIRATRNGPLHVRGSIEILGHDGTSLGTELRVALCRCGASGNKPFCDGSHAETGFRDGEAAT